MATRDFKLSERKGNRGIDLLLSKNLIMSLCLDKSYPAINFGLIADHLPGTGVIGGVRKIAGMSWNPALSAWVTKTVSSY
jgi:hypothetical protein